MKEMNIKQENYILLPEDENLLKELNVIKTSEPEVFQAIEMVIHHIHGSYSDKYAKGLLGGVDTKKMLYDKIGGKYINQYQVARYLQRYITQGSKKSGLLVDLFKMIHYIIFEIVRRIKADDIQINEPKI